jgi:hypothetical protein
MQRLASQRNWSTDAWQFDPGSNTLYSNTSDILGDTTVTSGGVKTYVVAIPGRKKEGPKYKVRTPWSTKDQPKTNSSRAS